MRIDCYSPIAARLLPASSSSPEMNTDTGLISGQADCRMNGRDIWQELSREYDVHNATFDDLKDIASRLYKAGEISLKELGVMTFDKGRLLRSMGYSIPAETYAKKDWIVEFRNRSIFNEKHGNSLGAKWDRTIVEILGRME